MSVSLIEPATLNEIGLYNATSVQLQSVSTVGATPSSGTKIYSVSGELTWLNTDGYTRTFSSALTLDHTYDLPDISDTIVTETATQTLTNKTFSLPTITVYDNAFTIENSSSPTKLCVFSLGGQSTSTTLTLASSNTGNSTITFPATSADTLVSLNAPQTLTYKTIQDADSSVYATGLWYGSYGGTITFATSGTPSVNQVLTATSSTTAVWQAPASGGVSSINQNGGTAETGAITLTNGNMMNITNASTDFTFAVTGTYAQSTSTGSTALGYEAASSGNTGALGNVAIGAYAGMAITSSCLHNTVIGSNAFQDATDDSSCVAVGYVSLHAQNGGIGNTAMGYTSGAFITTGTYNSLLGTSSGGSSLTTGSYGTYIGSSAVATGNYSYCTAIGASTSVGGNYGVAIGYGATAPNQYDVGIGTGTGAAWTGETSGGNNVLICPSQVGGIGGSYPLFRDSATSTGTGSSGSITIPATSQSGDLLLVSVMVNNSAANVTVPAGWQSNGVGYCTGGTYTIYVLYSYIIDNGTLHGTSPVWTFNSSYTYAMTLVGYYNVNQTTPFDSSVSVSQSGSPATSISTSSSTVTRPSIGVLFINNYQYAMSVMPTYSNILTYTTQYENYVYSSNPLQVGSAQTQSATLATADNWVAVIFIIRGAETGSLIGTVAVGENVNVSSDYAVAIGYLNSCLGSVVLGSSCIGIGTNSILIGSDVTTDASDTIAIGYGTQALGANDISIGTGAVYTAGQSSGNNLQIQTSTTGATGYAHPSYRTSTSTSGTAAETGSITIPSASEAGDFLIAVLSINGTETSATPPAGWTLSLAVQSPSGAWMGIYYIFNSGSLGGTSATWTWTPSEVWVLGVIVIEGVNATTPFDSTPVTSSGTAKSVSVTSNTKVYPSLAIAIGLCSTEPLSSFVVSSTPSYTFMFDTGEASSDQTVGAWYNPVVSGNGSSTETVTFVNSVLTSVAMGGYIAILRGTSSSSFSASQAIGVNCNAGGTSVISMGTGSSATGSSSVAIGTGCIAIGENSFVCGTNCTDGGYANCVVIGTNLGAVGAGQVLIGNGVSQIAAMEYTWYVPAPNYPYDTTTSTAASADFNGAIYWLETSVIATDVYVDVETDAASSTSAIGFYQSVDGSANTSTAWNRIGYANPVSTSTGSQSATITNNAGTSSITLQAGLVAVLWGASSTSVKMYTYTGGSFPFHTSVVSTGSLISVFTTANSYSTIPPQTFQPNSTGATASTSSYAIVFALA